MSSTLGASSRTAAFSRSVGLETALAFLLLALLLVSTLEEVALAPPLRMLWLAGFVFLTILNVGAAAGVYISAALIMSVHHFEGQASWVQRPDNYAFLFLVLYLLWARAFDRGARAVGATGVWVALLVGYGLLQVFIREGFDTHNLAWFTRMFGAPLGLCVLLWRAALSRAELGTMLMVLGTMGIYLAAISLLEAVGWYALVVPPWLVDPMVRGPSLESARVGGLAMQPEWNALELSLAFCLLLLMLRVNQRQTPSRVVWLAGCVLCLLAIYFTYTRAAWLGLLLGGVPLFWQISAARGVTVWRRAVFVAFALGFAAMVLWFPSDVLQSRVSDTGNVYFRFNIWAAGLQLLAEHPLVGVGYGQFSSHVGPYVRDLGWIPPSSGLSSGNMAHNTILSVAAEFGLIGLILYVVALVRLYRVGRAAAGSAWGRLGSCWVAGYTLVYLVNVQFIAAHELAANLLYFAVLGAVAGTEIPGTRPRPLQAHPGTAVYENR